MTVWHGLGAALLAALLVFLSYAQIQRNKLPVKFSTVDEFNAVQDVIRWARGQINAKDPRRKQIDLLWGAHPV